MSMSAAAMSSLPIAEENVDLVTKRYLTGLRTYIITLKFSDLSVIPQDTISRIEHGGDLWEFRADLLGFDDGGTSIPTAGYIQTQLRILRHMSKLPILFTVRTVSQGGKFPDNAFPEAIALMKLAIEIGCEYIDVEIDSPKHLIEEIQATKGNSKIVASYHDFDSALKWTSRDLRNTCSKAEAIGDIVKLCVQAADINDSLELALYVRDFKLRTNKPIIAVAMGPDGQLSRFTAPITFVTHELIPQDPGSDQLTLNDINCGLRLLGQIPRLK